MYIYKVWYDKGNTNLVVLTNKEIQMIEDKKDYFYFKDNNGSWINSKNIYAWQYVKEA